MDKSLESKSEYIEFGKAPFFNSQCSKKEKILNDLKYKIDYMRENHPTLNIIAIFLQGSQNYGLDDENSDIDTKAFCVPDLARLIEGKKIVSHIYVLPDNSHIEVKDIRLLPELLQKQNPSYLEIMNTQYYLLNDEKRGTRVHEYFRKI